MDYISNECQFTKCNFTKCQFYKCKKKINLIESTIKCRCDGIFCNIHRFARDHHCTFDFKDLQKKYLLNVMSSPKKNKGLIERV